MQWRDSVHLRGRVYSSLYANWLTDVYLIKILKLSFSELSYSFMCDIVDALIIDQILSQRTLMLSSAAMMSLMSLSVMFFSST